MRLVFGTGRDRRARLGRAARERLSAAVEAEEVVVMWGIVPALGPGGRAQPLTYARELVPVGTRRDGAVERPRAVSEHVIERMLVGGATRLCFVVPPGKHDVIDYWGGGLGGWGGGRGGAACCFVVQLRPAGLCDALFRALPL